MIEAAKIGDVAQNGTLLTEQSETKNPAFFNAGSICKYMSAYLATFTALSSLITVTLI